ncbi:hypothetical protein PWT90_10348 [Aphanocladium album]|nr:hypothetical protein PWT90_10348 [Aphanocladium album]
MTIPSSRAYSLLPLLLYVLSTSQVVHAKDKCQPVTWGKRDLNSRSSTNQLPPIPDQSAKFGPDGPKAGDLVCRFYIPAKADVNYYTCMALAQIANIDNEDFFAWNPDLKTDCSNVKPWTCDDCIAGNCYEGACPGDSVYSTSGKCGPQHGMRQCAGVAGHCCNLKGECGDGEGYCDAASCAFGNCTGKPTGPVGIPGVPRLPIILGNTTDGSCGGPDRIVCGVTWGNCCSGEGKCGSLPSHCGPGCQPQFGECDSSQPTTTATATPSSRPTLAFQAQPHKKADCTGDSGIDLVKVESGTNGKCVNLDCNAASLDIQDIGDCPGGQILISYWQESDCSGKWYGYGYSSRNTCRTLWGGGMYTKSLWLKCAPQSDDCISKGTCVADPEPSIGICAEQTPAFSIKSRYHTDCTGDVHNDMSVPSGSNGICINTDCMVGSLNIAGTGDCPDGQVQLSYWAEPGCAGDWYGYGYASRNSCRRLWTDGNKFGSMRLKCAKKEEDCLSKGTCAFAPEPSNSKC